MVKNLEKPHPMYAKRPYIPLLLCTSKTKEYYKVKNLIKSNTPFNLHNIPRCRGVLTTPSHIQERDFSKNRQGPLAINNFCKKLHLRSLTGFLIDVIK